MIDFLTQSWFIKQEKGKYYVKNSQTWANDHLRITTTCQQRTYTIFRSQFDLLKHKWPLNNDHVSTTATILGPKGGLTVLQYII